MTTRIVQIVVVAVAVAAAAGAAAAFLLVDRKLDVNEERLEGIERELESQRRELRRLRERLAERPGETRGDEPSDSDETGLGLFGDPFAADDDCVTEAGSELAEDRSFGDLLFGSDDDATVRDVARAVERLRELRFKRVPRPRYLNSEQLARRVKAMVDEYPSREAAADTRALVGLGALPAGSNLKALVQRALEQDVAGFYDPDTGELVVGSESGSELSALERIVLAHELEHALADEALGLPRMLVDALPREGTEDAAFAASALAEGDATLTMALYAAQTLSLLDAFESLGPALLSEAQLAELPHYVQASLVFPYEEGVSFVCRLHDRGGWRAVDRAYRRRPTTTAQILFPERYHAREGALDPPDPRPPGRGWRRLDHQAFGAAELLWLFEAPGGDDEKALSNPRARASAWAGGELRVWGRGNRTAVAVTLVSRRGAPDLCASMRAWRRAAFGGNRSGGVRAVGCRGRNVRLVAAPDRTTARALLRF